MRHESLIEKEFGKTIYDLEKISKLIKKVFKEFKISSKSRKFKNLLKELKFEHNDIDYGRQSTEVSYDNVASGIEYRIKNIKEIHEILIEVLINLIEITGRKSTKKVDQKIIKKIINLKDMREQLMTCFEVIDICDLGDLADSKDMQYALVDYKE